MTIPFHPLVIPGILDQNDAIFVTEVALHGDALAALIRTTIRPSDCTLEDAARRMMLRPEIAAAVAAVKRAQELAGPVEVTREALQAILMRIIQDGLAGLHEGSTLIAAVRLSAQLAALLTEKIEVTRNVRVEDLDEDTLRRIAARGMKVIEGEAREITADAALEYQPEPVGEDA